MGDAKPENIDALVDEILALRVENQRLRSLLGLDEPSRTEAGAVVTGPSQSEQKRFSVDMRHLTEGL